MTCRLCRKERPRLARSHIVPFGFISRGRKEHSLVSVGGDGQGRFLRKAIYDDGILCDDCEHDVLAPLDEYAIGLLRDKKESAVGRAADFVMALFKDVDRKKLRAFFASYLWRASVSTQQECAHTALGEKYEYLIGEELLGGGNFDYIDGLVTFQSHRMYENFLLPSRVRWGGGCNGYRGSFPHVSFMLKVDQRKPIQLMSEFCVEAEGVPVQTSFSLSDEYKGVAYGIAELEYDARDVGMYVSVIQEFFSKARYFPKVPGDVRARRSVDA